MVTTETVVRTTASIQVSARTVLRLTLAIVAGLLVAHLAAWVVLDILEPTWTLRLLDVGAEMSIPTWYSQLLLFCGAVVAYVLWRVEPESERRRYWLLIGVLMTYASIDEGAAIHELAIEPVQNRLDSSGGLLHFAWVVPFGLFVLFIVALLFNFWRQLPEKTRLLTAVAAVLYVVGAIGFEVAGAPMASDDRIESVPYLLVMTLEEGCEMGRGLHLPLRRAEPPPGEPTR